MSEGATSWSRETGRLYLKYMAAGLAAIPAGIIYGLLAMAGWERPWTVILILALGVSSALCVCGFIEKRWSTRRREILPEPANMVAYEASPQGIRVAPVPVASVAFVVILTFGSAVKGISVQTSTDVRPMTGTESTFFHHDF